MPGPKKSTNGRLARAQLSSFRLALRVLTILSEDLAARYAERLFLTPRRYDPPARETQALSQGLPYELRYRAASGDERRVATWRFGRGPTVLLAHGWSGRGGQLAPFIEPLVASGFGVLVFDAPAHGTSPGRQVSLVDFAETILAIDRQLGPLHAIVGHSMGGAAAAVAVQEGLAVERLVTIGAPVSVKSAAAQFRRITAIEERVMERVRRRVEQRYGRTFDELELGPKSLDEAPPTARALPLLVVHDRKDSEVAFASAEALVSGWPGARLHATSGFGHKRILREPTVVQAVVAFIAEARAEAERDAALVPRDPNFVYGLVDNWT